MRAHLDSELRPSGHCSPIPPDQLDHTGVRQRVNLLRTAERLFTHAGLGDGQPYVSRLGPSRLRRRRSCRTPATHLRCRSGMVVPPSDKSHESRYIALSPPWRFRPVVIQPRFIPGDLILLRRRTGGPVTPSGPLTAARIRASPHPSPAPPVADGFAANLLHSRRLWLCPVGSGVSGLHDGCRQLQAPAP